MRRKYLLIPSHVRKCKTVKRDRMFNAICRKNCQQIVIELTLIYYEVGHLRIKYVCRRVKFEEPSNGFALVGHVFENCDMAMKCEATINVGHSSESYSHSCNSSSSNSSSGSGGGDGGGDGFGGDGGDGGGDVGGDGRGGGDGGSGGVGDAGGDGGGDGDGGGTV
ncbi:keratin, type II cytoskeletal 1-like [Pocillopora damicornis]|uniref:keratin, type II cytoskeletal 1-like n=1 Tax=Pocillopora damicornis TaxID=46731 RepID=UPI000F54E09F|nr:keratin, type II cytoskeletal 1-like [Pocillopora damicornis]